MDGGERIREERGLFFGIIWVNGTHGSMVLALVKLEGEQNKGKYEAEGEIKAACQLTRRMDRAIYHEKSCKTTSIPIPILFRYSVYVYLIIRKSGQRAFIQFWNWNRKRRQSFLRTNTLEFIKRERVDLSFECFSNGIERCERIYTNYCFPILVNSMKSYLHFIKKKKKNNLLFFLSLPRSSTSYPTCLRKSLTVSMEKRGTGTWKIRGSPSRKRYPHRGANLSKPRTDSHQLCWTSVAGGYTKFSNHPSIIFKHPLIIFNERKKTSVENHVPSAERGSNDV